MNGDSHDPQLENGDESSEEESEQQKILDRQAKRRMYIEAKKERMRMMKKPASISDILNQEEKTLEPQTKFLNVKVHTRVHQDAYSAKSEASDTLIHLSGEIEISEHLTFEGLTPKAVELFNTQLKDKGYDIEVVASPTSSSFRFAKKTGEPDMNFPSFDGKQKVGDSGVTNVCLMLDPADINYPQPNQSHAESTVANTDNNYSEIGIKEPPKNKAKDGNIDNRKGGKSQEKIGQRDPSQLEKTNSSCK